MTATELLPASPHEGPPDNIMICGCLGEPLVEEARWPDATLGRLSWHVDLSGYRGRLTREQLRAAFAEAWGYWSAVLEISPVQVEAVTEALVRKHFAPIDGPSGTLAWSHLADNTARPKTQRYDTGDNWVIAERPTSGIDLVRVAAHEIGHVLGLPHDDRNAEALMAPFYSLKFRKPTERDVQRMVQLGYRRRRTVPPPPPEPGLGLTIDLDAKVIVAPTGWKLRHVG